MQSIPVVVLCPRQIDYSNCKTIANSEQYDFHFLEAPLDLSGLSQSFDIVTYIETCQQYIRQHNIKIVLATQDVPSLIQAALCEELEGTITECKGSSVESAFLCLHKYYTHEFLDPSPIGYSIWDLDADREEEIEKINIPFPWILKPCTTACSASIFKVSTPDEAKNAIAFFRSQIASNTRYLVPVLEKYLDRDRYPLMSRNLILIEEYIQSAAKCCVDGCIYDNEIFIWGICDYHYYPQNPECFADFIFPSILPLAIQNKLKKIYCQILEKLKKYGFNRQFIDIEFFVSADGEIKLMEINGRMAPVSVPIYRQCLTDGDPYMTLIEMARDRPISPPKLKDLTGGIFYITTLASDRADNLFDFELAEKLPHVEIRVASQENIKNSGDRGHALASISLVGKSYEEIHQQANKIRKKLLKQPEFSP